MCSSDLSLSPETKLLLDRLARGKAQAARWIKPGSTLVRSWGGHTHQVVVTALGFLWNGSVHASLSEIARLITGTRWNGPRFFGLRPSPTRESKAAGSGEEVSAPAADPAPSPRRRGRPRRRGLGVGSTAVADTASPLPAALLLRAGLGRRPKKRGPFQRVPVIRRAISDRLA